MNAEERAHIESLLQIHRAHLRELELQAARYGDLAVPSYVMLQITEYRQKIMELEQRMHADLPHHNLPPRDFDQFVGRQQELADVRKLLLPYPKSRYHLVAIDGIGGIGKSALALEIAYTLRAQPPRRARRHHRSRQWPGRRSWLLPLGTRIPAGI